jgi:CheY-like chemotaxis protein
MTYRPRILIAEHDPIIRDMVARSLTEVRYEVHTVNDGGTCLQHTQNERPDLVVLDSDLPDYDAVEIARRLRNEPTTASIAIILLTSLEEPGQNGGPPPHALRGQLLQYDDVDVDDSVTKPFTSEMLIATIRSVLDRHGA